MLYQTDYQNVKLFKRGKVRDVYELDNDRLLIIASDRISCFDVVIPTPIPDKGKILNKISLFWFDHLKDVIGNHVISADVNDLPQSLSAQKQELKDRFIITKRCKVIPFECVVRGYISGSGWKEYQQSGSVCGITLPEGLVESQKLSEPIFTPATKAEQGHDENVSFSYMADHVGQELAEKVRGVSIKLYAQAAAYAERKGIIIADTKFEFGFDGDTLLLVDEALTPDSSRFWPQSTYKPGASQPSFDKQFVRDYLTSTGWNKQPPAPQLPQEIVEKTQQKYSEAYEILIERDAGQ